MNVIIFSLFISLLQPIPTFKAVQAADIDYMGSIDGGPLEVLPGCSWYCGGDVSSFRSSTYLFKPLNKFLPGKAHDFDISTAWIEGKKGYGIGEFIEYTIDLTNPNWLGNDLSINELIIANGYKKSRKTWIENSRVKKFKMYVNNKAYGFIELIDSYEFQTVQIKKIKVFSKSIVKFRFEIVEVYVGTKFKDTAISELLFEGNEHH